MPEEVAETRAAANVSLDAAGSAEPTCPRGTVIGRFVVLEPIGRGGMGQVYKAYDPELAREVAIKLVPTTAQESSRSTGSSSSRHCRVLREAQALASLSHPNVISVHDVGTLGDEVYIVMEMVTGQTVRAWLKERRSVREIILIMVAAGRGLAAAHAAGLIHRDFKPDNVMIGQDGRVRVLDFGLARAAGQATKAVPEQGQDGTPSEPRSGSRAEATIPLGNAQTGEDVPAKASKVVAAGPVEAETKVLSTEGSSSTSGEVSKPSSLLNAPLTQMGSIIGTPAYMAPEQYLAAQVDARTDQFGYCVTLFEALYGKRPFRGSSTEALRRSVVSGTIRTTRGRRVPKRLRRIVRRGLSPGPADRYPDMDELLKDLERNPWRGRRRVLSILAPLVVVGAITRWVGAPQPDPCGTARTELSGVWDHATRQATRQAFLASGTSNAEATWTSTVQALDRYANAWASMHTSACKATRVDGIQSEALLDLRMACLARRRDELAALSRTLVAADVVVVRHAVQASYGLAEIALCADETALRAAFQPPSADERQAVARLSKEIDETLTFVRTGKYDDAERKVATLISGVEGVEYLPIRAEVELTRGNLHRVRGRLVEAEQRLMRAAELASAGGDAYNTAEALNVATLVVGQGLGRFQQGLTLSQTAGMTLALAGGNKALESKILNNRGTVYWGMGRYDEAARWFGEALDAKKEAYGSDHPAVGRTLANLGLVFQQKGELAKASKAFSDAHLLFANTLGAVHPHVARLLSMRGDLALAMDKPAEAQQHHERALGVLEAAVGTEHPTFGEGLRSLALALLRQDEYDKGLAILQRALGIFERIQGETHPEVVQTLNSIGAANQQTGAKEKARAAQARAVSICKRAACPAALAASAEFGLARALWSLEDQKSTAVALALAARGRLLDVSDAQALDIEIRTWLNATAGVSTD